MEKMHVPREKSCSGILIKKSIDRVEGEFGKILDAVLCRPNRMGDNGIFIKWHDLELIHFF